MNHVDRYWAAMGYDERQRIDLTKEELLVFMAKAWDEGKYTDTEDYDNPYE